jgi:hypothetical protein
MGASFTRSAQGLRAGGASSHRWAAVRRQGRLGKPNALSALVVHQGAPRRGESTPAMNGRFAHIAHRLTRGVGVMSMLVLALEACGNENEACSWLFAPASFVDAGQPGCTAEPAGETCDRSSGLCQNVCQPSEYLLTCRTVVVSGPAIPLAELEDSVVVSGGERRCRQAPRSGETSPSETAYCCACGR